VNLLLAAVATVTLGGLLLAGARELRGALAGLAVSVLLALALVGASLLLTPQPASPAGRSYAVGQHVVAGMDLMLVGFAAVGLGAAIGAGLRWRDRRRLARRPPS
jgi:hypothetical protein